MEKNNKKSISVFLAIGLVLASFLIGSFYSSYKYSFVDVPVASCFLDKRSVIKNRDIKYIKLPEMYLDKDIIVDESLLIGRYISSDYYVNEGSFFYSDFIEDESLMNDIDYINIDSNMTVYELNVNNIFVNAAHLNKNMYVDLYLTIEKPLVISDLFISNVKICGLYNNAYQEVEKNSDKSLSIISLIVNKDMVSLLNKALLIGDISIIPCNDPYTSKECFINRKGDIINYLN